MTDLQTQIESSTSDDVRAVLQRHFELIRATSPAESCHVMDPDAVLESDVVILGARRDGQLLAVGGLRAIGPDHGELKSMHTLQEARGQGAGKHVLWALLKHAQTMGFTKVSLETGSESPFQPARQMYQAHGFSECPPFADYVKDPLSVFMTRTL